MSHRVRDLIWRKCKGVFGSSSENENKENDYKTKVWPSPYPLYQNIWNRYPFWSWVRTCRLMARVRALTRFLFYGGFSGGRDAGSNIQPLPRYPTRVEGKHTLIPFGHRRHDGNVLILPCYQNRRKRETHYCNPFSFPK